jgi:ABC-type transport system involved in multi-copper enzyme maturation permease subunit
MIPDIFQFEMLRAQRRQSGLFLRWIYAAFLLMQIAPVFFLSQEGWRQLVTGFGIFHFLENFVFQHFLILLLLAPAMAGGAITEEKSRGTLQYLLTAHFQPWEIILGKVLANAYQLALLALVGLPLFCFLGGLAGDALFPLMVLFCSLVFLMGLTSLCMLVSVLCRTTRDALLTLYLVIGATLFIMSVLAATRFGAWLASLNPLRVLLPEDISLRWRQLGSFVLAWSVLGGSCVLWASWRMRRAFRRQLQFISPKPGRWWPGRRRPVRGNPVLWREQQVEGIAPLEGLRRLPRWLGMLAVMAGSALVLCYFSIQFCPATVKLWALVKQGDWQALQVALEPIAGNTFFFQGLTVLLVATLVVAIRASSAITAEKEKGTWLALMLTPMTAKRIISGKHWGIFWACLPYLAAHALAVLPLSLLLGYEAMVWAVLWSAFLVPAVILASAVGLWVSARAASSWRSLMSTLALFYLGWALFFLPTTCMLYVFKGMLALFVILVGAFVDTRAARSFVDAFSVESCALGVGVTVAYLFFTSRLLAGAVQRLGRNDRAMEMQFDYYYLYREYYRRKLEEQDTGAALEGIYAMQAPVLEDKPPDESTIPFQV